MDTNIIGWIEQQQLAVKENTKDRPVVTLAYAQSLEGAFAEKKGFPSTISSPDSTVLTHKLRATHSAIMVGSGTLLADDPLLNVRFSDGKNPIPVLLDTNLKISLEARILQNASQLFIFCSMVADKNKFDQLLSLGAQIIPVSVDDSGLLPLSQVLKILRKFDIESLMVEGGPKLIHSLLSEQLWDLAVITLAPFWMGGYGLNSFNYKERIPLQDMNTFMAGNDLILTGARI